MSQEKFKKCIEACYSCAPACKHGASEDLKEADIKMLIACVYLDRERAA
jgi:hypothetical protein